MLPGFDDLVTEMDDSLVSHSAGFGLPVILHLADGDKEIDAIVDIQGKTNELGSGGYLGTLKAKLTISRPDSIGITERTAVTVGDMKWFVLREPELRDSNLVEVPIGELTEQSSKPAIRY